MNEGSGQVEVERESAGMIPGAIPTPWKLQVRRLRYQVAPVVIFLVAATTAGLLWKRHVIGPTTVGEVEAVRVVITSPADGTLIPLPREILDHNIEKFHRVRAGDVIAKMDDGPFIAAASRHENELDKLRRRLSDKQRQLASLTGGVFARPPASTQKASEQKAPDGSVDQLKLDISSLEEEVRFQESILRDLNQKIAACTIRSPVSGTVATIFAYPGTSVRQGREIMTITEDQGQYIVSYIRPNQGMRPKKDMLVDIRTAERRLSRSRVQEVGNDVQPVPPQQLANPRMPEWGVPVRIAMPSDVRLKPGELVGLVYRPELSAAVTSGAAGASATD